MKQLAKLAQAIVHGPKLLFLDEPTNGLDPPARQRMIRLIQEIRERGDLHLILCSHLLRDVEETCDEVLILKEGRIVHLLQSGRGAQPEPQVRRAGDARRERAVRCEASRSLGCECAWSGERRASKLVLRESDRRSATSTAWRPSRTCRSGAELQARQPRRHFPEGDGERPMAVYKRGYGRTQAR